MNSETSINGTTLRPNKMLKSEWYSALSGKYLKTRVLFGAENSVQFKEFSSFLRVQFKEISL